MKEIEVITSLVPAKGRSKNYQGLSRSVVSSASSPSAGTSGSSDTAKVAQNLAADSTDWDKIIRKDKEDSTLYAVDFQAGLKVNGSLLKDVIKSNGSALVSDDTVFTSAKVNNLLNAQSDLFISKTKDDRTEHNLGIGQNLTVDGTGTFGGLLKAAALTITGAVFAATVSANTMTANVFNGDLNGNAATATKLKTTRTIWGQSFDGTGNVSGRLSLDESSVYWKEPNFGDQFAIVPSFPQFDDSNILCFQSAVGDLGTTPSLSTKMVIAGKSGNVGIGTTSPNYKLDVNGNARIASDLYADATVGTRNFASRTTGWNVNAQGAADFRNIYADELRVQAFTADISQALAGSDYLTKSVSKLSANFIVPAVNSTVRIIVDDIEGMPATRCFSNGDYIRFRAFNRTSGLTIANVWGTVVLDTTFGSNGFTNGTQAYTFTCTATSGAGLTVFKGSEVLDYGTSGSGLISRTTLDAQGSPYEQIATWINDPSVSTNYTVHARLGNLNGIANCNGYGLYSNKAFLTDSVTVGDLTKTNHYLDFSNGKLTVQGDIRLSSGDSAVSTLDMSRGINLAVNNIQIGGRNLIGGTKDFSGLGHDGVLVHNDYLNFTSVNNNDWTKTTDICMFGPQYLKINQYYTLSFYAKSTVSGDKIRSHFYPNVDGYGWDGLTYTTLTTEWKRYSITWYRKDLGAKHVIVARLMTGEGLGNVSVCGVKFEEGNKATDWTPAPEDVDANISSAKSAAISQSATNAASLYVTQTAYSAQVSILQNSISSKVSQTDFNALGTRVGSAESTITQHSTDIASKVSQTDFNALGGRVSSTESSINQLPGTIDGRITTQISAGGSIYTAVASSLTLNGNGISLFGKTIDISGAVVFNSLATQTQAQGYASTAQSNAATDATNKVNAIQVGGRNLAVSGSYNTKLVTISGNGDGSTEKVYETDIHAYLKANVQYIFSCNTDGVWGQTSVVDTVEAFLLKDSQHSTYYRMKSNVCLFTPSVSGSYYLRLDINQNNKTHSFSEIQIEEGNKKTTYTPAPEDIDAEIVSSQNSLATNLGYASYTDMVSAASAGHTIINGGYLRTSLIEVNGLSAAVANVISLDASRITSGTISTDRLDANAIVVAGLSAQTIDANNATIRNLKVTNINIEGNIRSPFLYVDSGGSYTIQNNIVLPSVTSNTHFTDSVKNVGRIIRLIHFMDENGNLASGTCTVDTQNSDHTGPGAPIYEDGVAKTSINMSRGIVEMLGFGTETIFRGWIIISRKSTLTYGLYGSPMSCLARGIVTMNAGYAPYFSNQWTWNNGLMSVSRISQGQYNIEIGNIVPSGHSLGDYMVMCTGVGTSIEAPNDVYPIKATVGVRNSTWFRVYTSDDNTVNDGSFEFQIFTITQ